MAKYNWLPYLCCLPPTTSGPQVAPRPVQEPCLQGGWENQAFLPHSYFPDTRAGTGARGMSQAFESLVILNNPGGELLTLCLALPRSWSDTWPRSPRSGPSSDSCLLTKVRPQRGQYDTWVSFQNKLTSSACSHCFKQKHCLVVSVGSAEFIGNFSVCLSLLPVLEFHKILSCLCPDWLQPAAGKPCLPQVLSKAESPREWLGWEVSPRALHLVPNFVLGERGKTSVLCQLKNVLTIWHRFY